jgi:hypothetical protein
MDVQCCELSLSPSTITDSIADSNFDARKSLCDNIQTNNPNRRAYLSEQMLCSASKEKYRELMKSLSHDSRVCSSGNTVHPILYSLNITHNYYRRHFVHKHRVNYGRQQMVTHIINVRGTISKLHWIQNQDHH